MSFERKWLAIAVAIAWALAWGGCNKQEKLYHVKGTATFQGQPIPKGRIFFDGDEAKSGQGSAGILDGSYDTAQDGQGIKGGTYSVRVQGYTGKAANELPFGQAIFSEYTFSKELPAEDTTFDVVVPKGR